MSQKDNGFLAEEQSTVTLKERLSQYFAYWPLFLVCVCVCICTGIFYIRYSVPKYMAYTTFLVKGGNQGALITSDLIEATLNGNKDINLSNEMLLLGSSSLMERTVVKNGYNVTYYRKGRLHNIEIYKEAPFNLVVKTLINNDWTYELYVKNINITGGTFLYGPEKAQELYSFKWGVPFLLGGQSFVLMAKKQISDNDRDFLVRWNPVQEAAAEISNQLSIKSVDPKTSVIQLSLKTENLQRGKDVLNSLFAEFNTSDIEDRNKISDNTVKFIDDRLLAISQDLKAVEGNLETYQGSNRLVDIKSQFSQSLENSNEVSKTIKNLAIQQSVTDMILKYFADPLNNNQLVPSSLGLNDATLSSLITQYNELKLKKDREAPLVAPNSTVMQDLNTQIGNLKGGILESLNSISKNLRMQESSFKQQNSSYQSFLSAVPHNERVMQEIKRKQGITEGLYLYLLQKREETAISSTASQIEHYKQIDLATGYGPVEPNSINILAYTALLGFFLAFAFIYIRDLLNDKINTKEEIRKKVSFPIVGEISHIKKKNKLSISIFGRNLASEQFRAIRTNLSFLIKQNHGKTILVTSSNSGEGKSFVSLNLAAVCAIPGNKVALLEFDLRNPSISKNFNAYSPWGLTDYLNGYVDDISEVYQTAGEIPSLHIFSAGPPTVNPTDLLLTENINRLFEVLKLKYDYIIIDSPPAGAVSDSFILGKYSNLVLYIIRQQNTFKKQLDFINEISNNKTLNNIALILNDIKQTSSYGYNYNYPSKNGVGKERKDLV